MFTQRLELIEATVASLQSAVRWLTDAAGGAENVPDARSASAENRLDAILHAHVPATWPMEHLDVQAIEWTLRHLQDPELAGSASFYWVLLREGASSRTLVGGVGFHTPQPGTVQVGYGVCSDYRRRGIASEATRVVLAELRKRPAVQRIIALTYPDHVASLGVMRKCGMTYVGPGAEEGTVEYELPTATAGKAR